MAGDLFSRSRKLKAFQDFCKFKSYVTFNGDEQSMEDYKNLECDESNPTLEGSMFIKNYAKGYFENLLEPFN